MDDAEFNNLFFANIAFAQILRRVQSIIIKNGYELERLVTDLTTERHIDDLDDFLSHPIMPSGTNLVTKRIIRKSKMLQGKGIEHDLVLFQHLDSSQMW